MCETVHRRPFTKAITSLFIDSTAHNTRNVSQHRNDRRFFCRRQWRGSDMKWKRLVVPLATVWTLIGGVAAADPKPIAPDAKVYIIWPADGQVIPTGKFWVRMGLSNAGVAPAGVEKANTGHHHLIVDVDLPPMDEEIPNDKNHLHYGLGQTEAHL